MSANNNQVPPITEEDIAEFLVQTPDFFERQAQVLTGVHMVSPYGNRTVSLQERQAEMLRDKIKGLEHRIMDMMRNGSQNHHTIDRIHHWTCDVVKTRNPLQLPEVIADSLMQHFEVPQVALRLWDVAETYLNEPFAQGVSADARSFASSLSTPYCGPNVGVEPAGWLPDSAQVQSVVLLPLRDGAILGDTPAWGLLVLGSPDPARFQADMDTDLLERMGEIAASVLCRLR
ncbi:MULTISPECIES: DUF484 family protein [Comamonas]|jgi:uncharacterized protein|uniref:DUF484 family protein n=1 Tax=Comamonas sediminis TaxID=1783360 RepID=A0ABV4B5L1_9BURK|nr:DUF484 family protein [Comamonas sp.]